MVLSNEQPWLFFTASRDSALSDFLACLKESNQLGQKMPTIGFFYFTHFFNER